MIECANIFVDTHCETLMWEEILTYQAAGNVGIRKTTN